MLTYVQEEATKEDLQKIKQAITDVTNVPVLGDIAKTVAQNKVGDMLSADSLEFIKGRLDNLSDINEELPDALGNRVDYGSKQRVDELDYRIDAMLDNNKGGDRIIGAGVKLYDMVAQHGNY